MARVIAPNKGYTGVSAGVPFTGGEGHTDNPYLVEWFRGHGYEIIENDAETKPAEKPKRSRKKVG